MLIDADAEQLLIDWLAVQMPAHGFDGIAISDRVPQQGVESITVIRTGGVRRDMVTDQPQISVDVRAARNTRAVEIISMVRALFNDMYGQVVDGYMIYTVGELSGPYSNPGEPDFCRYSQNFLFGIRSKTAA